MAKENVSITFSADTQQARRLFQEIAEGADKVGQKAKKTSTEFQGLGRSIGGVVTQYVGWHTAMTLATKLLDDETKAIQRRSAAFKEYQSGMDRVAVEGGLSKSQEKALRGAINQAGVSTAADSPAQVQALAASLLEARFSPEVLQSGGLLAAQQGLTAMNATGANVDSSRLGKSLANIMQATGTPMTAAGIGSTSQQMHGLLNATGLEMGDAESLLTGFGRISPKQAKALAMVGLKPEQLDPRRHGIGGAMQAWYGATDRMNPSTVDTVASRVFGDSGATALRRARDGFDPRLADPAAYQRDLGRATTGVLADARRQNFILTADEAANGQLDFQYQQGVAAHERTRKGLPIGRAAGKWLGRMANPFGPMFGSVGGVESAVGTVTRDTEAAIAPALLGDKYKQHVTDQGRIIVEIRDVHGTRASGFVQGTQHLRGLQQ